MSHSLGCPCDDCYLEEATSLCADCTQPLRADEVRASRAEHTLRCDACSLARYDARNAARCATCGDKPVAKVGGVVSCDRCLQPPRAAEGAAA